MPDRENLAFLRTPLDPETVREQESVLIFLNLILLAAIGAVHILFGAALGTPSRLFFAVLMGRFLMQAMEFVWLRGTPLRPTAPVLARYVAASIWANIAFAFGIAMLGGKEETHYVVLMVIPVVAAAFRCTPAGIVVVVAAATGLTFLEVAIYYSRHAPMGTTEYFEATNVVLVYAVVAAIVALLAGQLRREKTLLNGSLAELERTRDRLVAEEKLAAIGRLAGAIAHEVRNPVAMIASSLALARDAGADIGAREEWHTVAADEARRLERLTGDFLAYARQRPPERQAVALDMVVGYVAGVARARATTGGQTLEAIGPEGVIVVCDPFQIQQALLNLAVNACDATPRGGRIVVGGNPLPGGGAELFVENEGAPVPDAAIPNLFEPFFTTKAAGSGLGLAISRTIARAHGGDLLLSANQPGRVRFTLHLPAAAAGPAEA